MNRRQRQKKERPLSRAEQAVMDQVWSRGPVSAEDCRTALVETWPMKDSTIRTVLRRLEAKGYVRHEVDGRTFRYRAVDAPVAVATRAVRQLIDRFCGGSAETLMLGLVNAEVIGARDLQRIQQRIAAAKRVRK